MEFDQVLARRYSCRAYGDRPVEREKITACLEAARVAPSSCNIQRWMFLAVDEKPLCDGLAEALADREIKINLFTKQIPAFIVILRHPPRREPLPYQKKILATFDHPDMDIGIAAAHICLRATDLGLGSVMMGWFDEAKIKGLLRIPEGLEVALVVGLGYPADDSPRDPRRYPMEDVVRWNGF